MNEVPPPLLKSLMTSRSPSLCTPLKLEPPPFGVLPNVTLFWKNQKPCCASPLLSKRSDPKYKTSHVVVPLVLPPGPGQLALEGTEYRVAKPCWRLSLSGRPPASFQA